MRKSWKRARRSVARCASRPAARSEDSALRMRPALSVSGAGMKVPVLPAAFSSISGVVARDDDLVLGVALRRGSSRTRDNDRRTGGAAESDGDDR